MKLTRDTIDKKQKFKRKKKHKKESDTLGYVLGTWIAGFHSTPPIQRFITLKKKRK
jgi:hypothetical protein